jgi:hypothetical protein
MEEVAGLKTRQLLMLKAEFSEWNFCDFSAEVIAEFLTRFLTWQHGSQSTFKGREEATMGSTLVCESAGT